MYADAEPAAPSQGLLTADPLAKGSPITFVMVSRENAQMLETRSLDISRTCWGSRAALNTSGLVATKIFDVAATCCGQPHACLSQVPTSTPPCLLQVDVCCFDKTGTLTSDNMVLEGVAGLPGRGSELMADVQQAGSAAIRVLACCHSLIHVDGDLVGDPLEKAAFIATGGQQQQRVFLAHAEDGATVTPAVATLAT